MMRILFCGGGTEGHVAPSLAIAEEIKSKHCGEFMFVGRCSGAENKKILERNYPFSSIDIQSLSSFCALEKWKYVFILQKAITEAQRILQDFGADIVFGTGGYVTYPVVVAAHRLKIPIVLHESNAVAGHATKMLARYAHTVLLGVEGSEDNFRFAKRLSLVGTPIRRNFYESSRDLCRRKLGLGREFFIFSFGGSLGAKFLNELCLSLMEQYSQKNGFAHVHATGQRYYDTLDEKYDIFKKSSGKCRAVPFIDDISTYLRAADVVICRAGAATIGELRATGACPILIPSPNVKNNHQYFNAKALRNIGGAILFEEKDITASRLSEEITRLRNEPGKIAQIKQKCKSDLGRIATHKILDILLKITGDL